jgi:hypothetical protein
VVDYQTISIVLTGIGMIIALTYYALQIRNQSLARKAQIYMQLYNVETSREFQSSEIDVNRVEVSDPEEARKEMRADKELLVSWRRIFLHADQMGAMLKSGLLDPEMIVHFGTGAGPIMTWKRWKPYILWLREQMNFPDYLAGFEYYANEMTRLRRERGYSTEWSLEEGRWM